MYPANARTTIRDGRNSLKNKSSITGVGNAENRVEKPLMNPETNSPVDKSFSSPSHPHAPSSYRSSLLFQPKISASKPLASCATPTSPPEDSSFDTVPPLSASTGHRNTRRAGSNGDSLSTVQEPVSRINPKVPQKGRRIGSIPKSSSTVPSLTSKAPIYAIYPSFTTRSVLSPPQSFDPPKSTMKFSRKSPNQDRHSEPRLHPESKVDCGVHYSDRANDNPHDYVQHSTGRGRDDRLAQSKSNTSRNVFASSKPPGTIRAELQSSHSSESTSSSSHLISNSLQASPAQTSYSITSQSLTCPSTATSATSSASPDSVTNNPNFASSSDKYDTSLQHSSNSAHEHIKLHASPSLLGNMLAVSNTSVKDTFPSSPSQSMTSPSASGMMPQFANFQYYSPNMMPSGPGMSNPFILAAMVDGSGRSFPLDLSMMQQHMLNPPHFSSRSPSFPGKATVSGSPYPPPRHHSSKNVNSSQQTCGSSGKNPHIPSFATPSSPITFRETATSGLRAQSQGQLHTPEGKSSHVTSSSRGVPHNHRHDKSSRAHPPVTFSLAHTGVNGSKRLSSSSDSLRTPSTENSRLSSSSSDSRSHRYSDSSRHSFGSWSSHQHIANCKAPITPNVSARPVAAAQTSTTSNQPPAAPVQTSKDSGPLEAASKARDTNVDSADDGKSGLKVEIGDLVEKEGSIMKVDEKGGSTMTVDEALVSGEAQVTLTPEADQSSPPLPSSPALALPPARDEDCESLSGGVETELTSPSSAVEEEISEQYPPTYFPITLFLSKPDLLASLLPYLSFYDWCMIASMSKTVHMMLTGNELLKEEVLERFLGPAGYSQWTWREPEPISLTLRDLHDYMRCIFVPNHEYTRVAELYLKQQKIPQAKRDSDVLQSAVLLRDATRAYNRVLLRIRAQAEKDPDLFMANSSLRLSCATQSPGSPIQAPNPPLFRLRHAPLLRVFIPSPGGDWLSDSSVQQCEAELKYAEVTKLLRLGDVVWDIAVGDNGNFGRMIWDGQYLIDLDYTYSDVGDVPKYIPSLAFPPSYFHRVLRTNSSSSDPIVRLDISPWGEEIASNLQLLQNKNKGIPQAACHNTNWVHQSSFTIKSPRARSLGSKRSEKTGEPSKSAEISHGVPIIDFQGLFVDSGWYGKIVIETEGTGDSLADLQDRCGPGAFPSRVQSSARSMLSGRSIQKEKDARKVFRIIRERSHPGELWLRAVSSKESRRI